MRPIGGGNDIGRGPALGKRRLRADGRRVELREAVQDGEAELDRLGCLLVEDWRVEKRTRVATADPLRDLICRVRSRWGSARRGVRREVEQRWTYKRGSPGSSNSCSRG